jgi:hypothetical protein
MHLLFLCPFSKAAWFSHPWYIKTEPLAAACASIPDMVQTLLSFGHPHINLLNLYLSLVSLENQKQCVIWQEVMQA